MHGNHSSHGCSGWQSFLACPLSIEGAMMIEYIDVLWAVLSFFLSFLTSKLQCKPYAQTFSFCLRLNDYIDTSIGCVCCYSSLLFSSFLLFFLVVVVVVVIVVHLYVWCTCCRSMSAS